MMLHGQGRLGEAERVYRSILAGNPGQFDALRLLALIRYQQGQLREAHELIAQGGGDQAAISRCAVRADGGAARARSCRRGARRLRSNSCASILATSTRSTIAALLLSRLRRFEEALAVYDKVLAREPGSVAVRCSIAAMCWPNSVAWRRPPPATTRSWPAIPAMSARSPIAAMRLLRLGRYRGSARRVTTRCSPVKPDDINALGNRAIALKELGRYDEAMAELRAGSGGRSRRDRRADHARERPDRAQALRGRAVELPAGIVGQARRRRCAQQSGRRAHALAADTARRSRASIRRSQSIHGGRGCWTIAGSRCSRLGRFSDALESYDRALAIKPDDAETLYHRGHALANLGRYGEAIEAWQRVLAIDPGHPHALGSLAFYQLMICDWKETERIAVELERALADGKQDGRAVHAARLFGRAGGSASPYPAICAAIACRRSPRSPASRNTTLIGKDQGRLSFIVLPPPSDRLADRRAVRAA